MTPTLSLADLVAGTQAWVQALPHTHYVTSLCLGVPMFKMGTIICPPHKAIYKNEKIYIEKAFYIIIILFINYAISSVSQ